MNTQISPQLTLLFLIFSIIYCTLSFFSHSMPLEWAIKILPILLLLLVSIAQFKNAPDGKLKLFIIGLLFCMGGDIFLAVDRENLFVFGLGSFLIGHLFYISAMLPITKKNGLGLLGLLIYGVAMMSILIPNLAALFVPVVIYMLVLLLMTAACMTSTKSNIALVAGGISFTISDSLIGIDKFYCEIPHAGLWIMITYYLAQFCLTYGFLQSHSELKTES